MAKKIIGKRTNQIGIAPAILLINPKFPRNVAQIIRTASCFGIEQVWYTGNRIALEEGERLPREERMKGYSDVDLVQFDYPFEHFKGATPVAVELSDSAEPSTLLEHPENALYVFGPEDGGIPQVTRQHCHKFVVIPTRHCLNLSQAVTIMLYDRLLKRHQSGQEPILSACDMLAEPRGFQNFQEISGSADKKKKTKLSDYIE